jgi:hypothetical protein
MDGMQCGAGRKLDYLPFEARPDMGGLTMKNALGFGGLTEQTGHKRLTPPPSSKRRKRITRQYAKTKRLIKMR